MRLLLRTTLVAFLVAVGVSIYLLYVTSYDDMLLRVAPVKIYKTIWGVELEGTRFNEQRHQTLRIVVVIVGIILILISSWLVVKANWLGDQIICLCKLLKSHIISGLAAIQSLENKQKVFLYFSFLVIIVFKIFILNILKLNDDEVRAFEYFVDQGFWITLTYYPDTNNHIFYNLLCFLPDLFIDDGVLVMRVTALIGNLLLLLFLFVFTLRRFGFNVAIIALSFSSFIWETALFGGVGRGHLWMCFFSMVSLWALIRFLETTNNLYLVWVITFSVLGLFTVPTYLFFLASSFAYAVIYLIRMKRYDLIQLLLFAGGLITVLTLLLYLPVILVNGMDVLTNHRWVQSLGIQKFLQIFPVYLKELPEYILGLHGHIRRSYILAALLLVVFLVLFKYLKKDSNEKQWLLILFVFYFTALIMVCWLQFLPPYRVFTYFIFMWHIGIGILINQIIITSKMSSSLRLATLILIFLLCTWVGIDSFIL